jgi:septal ring factor EnvC (AmiA/AmiB activator)
LLSALFGPGLARAQDSRELESLEAALRASRSESAKLSAAAAALAAQVTALQTQLVTRAAAARETEVELSRLRAQLAVLEQQQDVKRAQLAGRREALVASLAALERVALTPPGAALASASLLDLARGEMLLAFAVPVLQRRSVALKGEIANLDSIAAQISDQRNKAMALGASLQAEQEKIAALLNQKTRLQQRTAAQAAANDRRMAELATEARDLRDLLQRLAHERMSQPATAVAPAPASARPFPTVPGSLMMPVVGPILTRFGVADANGSRSKGILVRARPGASVLAPFDGQVVFRGPFRSYGEILIIQHSGGYHSLLAGLGRSDAAVGQWVLAGEPVGVMGSPQDGDPKLYVELRRDGHPIDPAPWLDKSDTNVE